MKANRYTYMRIKKAPIYVRCRTMWCRKQLRFTYPSFLHENLKWQILCRNLHQCRICPIILFL